MQKKFAFCVALLALLTLTACNSGADEKQDEFDVALCEKLNEANNYALELEDYMQKITDGQETAGISAMDNTIADIWVIQNSLDDFETDTSEKMLFVGAVRAYVANTRVVYEKCLSFTKDGKPEDYYDFLHYYGMENELLDNATEKRITYLKSIGLTADEIAEIDE